MDGARPPVCDRAPGGRVSLRAAGSEGALPVRERPQVRNAHMISPTLCSFDRLNNVQTRCAYGPTCVAAASYDCDRAARHYEMEPRAVPGTLAQTCTNCLVHRRSDIGSVPCSQGECSSHTRQ